ncbi:MAG: hypothetical protein PHV16_01710 [Candidatus Nanoarchaeia archaeon]|nr:hypothetical protein [Candidatus Nanoarchaeia archaeon]
MKTIYPRIAIESSSFFTTAVAAALADIRAQSTYKYLWHYLKPSPHIFYTEKMGEKADVNKLAENVIECYDILGDKKFDYIIIGPGSGGAADLANAMNAPLLPVHTMVIELRLFNPIQPDDIERYVKEGTNLAERILKKNKDIDIVIHDDVVHDRSTIKWYLINRIKFKKLPDVYNKFIKRFLKKDGTIIFIDNKEKWEQYNIKKNIRFQLGGYGGINFKEYIKGSKRIDEWLKKSNQPHRGGWKLNYKTEKRPESEWGTPVGLDKNTKDYCKKNNIKFIEIETKNINEISLLSAYLWHERNRKGKGSKGYSIGTFWAHSPTASALSRHIPYWVPWPDEKTIKITDNHFRKMINDFDVPKKMIFARYGAIGPDIVGIQGWEDMLKKYFKEENIKLHGSLTNLVYNGLKKKVHSLATLKSIETYIKNITTWAKTMNSKSKPSLNADDLISISKKLKLKVIS